MLRRGRSGADRIRTEASAAAEAEHARAKTARKARGEAVAACFPQDPTPASRAIPQMLMSPARCEAIRRRGRPIAVMAALCRADRGNLCWALAFGGWRCDLLCSVQL